MIADSATVTAAPRNRSKALQHLYEFRVHKDGANAPTLIARTRQTFLISPHAEAMTQNKGEFIIGPREEVLIRVFICESLGITGWSETDFFGPNGFEYIKQFGLLPCLSDDAFGIRAAHSKQKLDEWIRIAHVPISARGHRRLFDIGHDRGSGRYVGGRVRSDFGLDARRLVALRVA